MSSAIELQLLAIEWKRLQLHALAKGATYAPFELKLAVGAVAGVHAPDRALEHVEDAYARLPVIDRHWLSGHRFQLGRIERAAPEHELTHERLAHVVPVQSGACTIV